MKILKLFIFAILLFLSKHLLQAIIEWTDIIPIRPKSYIWTDFTSSKVYFIWQFFYVFWAYFLIIIITHYFLKKTNFDSKKIRLFYFLVPVIIFVFLLIVYKFQFPYKQLYFPKRETLNFNLIEDFCVYTITTILMIKFLTIFFRKA